MAVQAAIYTVNAWIKLIRLFANPGSYKNALNYSTNVVSTVNMASISATVLLILAVVSVFHR